MANADSCISSPVFKNQASSELLEQVRRVENQSDKWLDGLALFSFPRDVAVWGVLTQIVGLIEQYVDRYGHGSQEQREAMINLGRDCALLFKNLPQKNFSEREALLRWTSELRDATNQAVLLAHNYSSFVSCFSMWHKYRQGVEIISPTRLRFSAIPSSTDRRIRAQQQGARIKDWPSTRDNPVDRAFVNDPDVALLLSRLAGRVQLEGALAMSYPDDSELLSVLRNIFDRRLHTAFRRNSSLNLGGYALMDVRRVFAALYSLSAVHEYLCDLWRKTCGRYPFESAVMVKAPDDWVDLICNISGVPSSTVRLIVEDLTFGAIRPLDIYIHLFVPSSNRGLLFLIPHFVLNTRPEENILRICSYARPKRYSTISNAKEREMRQHIRQDAPGRFKISGPFKFTCSGGGDIDLIITDYESSSVLIGELKWVRKAAHPLEHLDRDAELEVGFKQALKIKRFLASNPNFLRDIGLHDPKKGKPKLNYFVIARDHLMDKVKDKGVYLAEFDALIWALQSSRNLAQVVTKLRGLEWLPSEGREFKVTFEVASVAGVAVETETFHRLPTPRLAESA
jgi:hypothetical protein